MKTDVIDIEQIKVLQQVEKETHENIIEQVINVFKEETPETIEAIKQNINELSFTEISFYAHKLKSSCYHVGAKKMAHLCLQIETESKKENKLDYSNLINQVHSEFLVFLEEFQNIEEEDI